MPYVSHFEALVEVKRFYDSIEERRNTKYEVLQDEMRRDLRKSGYSGPEDPHYKEDYLAISYLVACKSMFFHSLTINGEKIEVILRPDNEVVIRMLQRFEESLISSAKFTLKLYPDNKYAKLRLEHLKNMFPLYIERFETNDPWLNTLPDKI